MGPTLLGLVTPQAFPRLVMSFADQKYHNHALGAWMAEHRTAECGGARSGQAKLDVSGATAAIITQMQNAFALNIGKLVGPYHGGQAT